MKKQTTETDAAAIAGSNMLLPSAWISVKEQLPEIGVVVILASCEGDVCAGSMTTNSRYPFRFIQDDISIEHRDDDEYFDKNAWIKNVVTHWMPLPCPPAK